LKQFGELNGENGLFKSIMCLRRISTATAAVVLAALVLCSLQAVAAAAEPALSDERAVFQTQWGDIHFGFYPDVSRLMQIQGSFAR
jgi:hypothetical protein